MTLGKALANEFRQRHNREPAKSPMTVRGRPLDVNVYNLNAETWIPEFVQAL